VRVERDRIAVLVGWDRITRPKVETRKGVGNTRSKMPKQCSPVENSMEVIFANKIVCGFRF
jgi:hypothetical protein